MLTQDEIRRFLIQANEEGYHEFFLLELTTGMRRGEILGLQWKDVNFATGELHIRRQVVKKGAQTQITKPKTKSSIRTLILPPDMLDILAVHKKMPPASGCSHRPSRKESREIPTRYTANSKRSSNERSARRSASTTCATPSLPWRLKTAWISRLSPL